MTVDLTSSVSSRIKILTREYTVLIEKKDFAGAKAKALEISHNYKTLAKMSPMMRESNLKNAESWDTIASRPVDTADNNLSSNGSLETVTEKQKLEMNAESLITKTFVRWDDIAGLHSVKRLLRETVVLASIKKPASVKPQTGILLFGPPGTGKTLLASAAAGSLNAAFYNVKVSSLMSRYFGESSKLVSALYDSARNHSPALVFIDEIESICPSRDGDVSEGSQQVLSTFLSELDGLTEKGSDNLVLTIAATNTPWALDPAVLSRFPRKVYVPLPDAEMCESMIKIHMNDLDTSQLNIGVIAQRCADQLYSGRDIDALCKAAIENMIHDAHPDLYSLSEKTFDELKQVSLQTRPLHHSDFDAAFDRIKSSVSRASLARYREWAEQYGEFLD